MAAVNLSPSQSGVTEHSRTRSRSNVTVRRRDSKKRRKSKKHKKKKKKKKSGNPPRLPLTYSGSGHHEKPNMELLVHGFIHECESNLPLSPIPDDVVNVVLKCCAYYQFTFDDEPSTDCFVVSRNKLSATLIAGQFGTIRFGEFLTSEDQCIYRVTFSMPQFQAAFVGVGFISKEFDQWMHPNFNLCESHCAYVYGNGFYRLSPQFQELNKQWGPTVSCPPFADSEVADGAFYVEVNTRTMTAHISCIDAAEQCILFTFKLHLPEEVAIVIDAGDESQPIVVTEQTFVYYP